MSRFNKTVTPRPARSRLTTNLAGGQAYTITPKLELTLLALTTKLENTFYRSANATADRVIELLAQVPVQYATQLALYARHKFGMRSISHLMAAELAGTATRGVPGAKNFFRDVIYRPDDALEIFACYMQMYGKPIPKALQRGTAMALSQMSEYSLAKYRKSSSELKMVDLVNLTRPQGTEALGKLINGTLNPAETWETMISAAGQEVDSEEELGAAKAEAWDGLLMNRKLGYMALLRNLRNLVQSLPNRAAVICEQLTDADAIQRSKVFPFRFYTAFTAVQSVAPPSVLEAIVQAADLSLANTPVLPGKTLVVLDVSGSMTTNTTRSKITCAEQGALFAAALVKRNMDHADLMVFASNAAYMNARQVDRTIPTLRMADQLAKACTVGQATNFESIFLTADKPYDRLIILSDMQGWRGASGFQSAVQYAQKFGVDPYVYSFDLTGYGSLQFPQSKTFALGGFSNSIFDTMALLENDPNALFREIADFAVPVK